MTINYMGQLLHKAEEHQHPPLSSKLINDIYNNFTLGNQVIIHSLRKRTPPVRRIKQSEALLMQLLEPFARADRYAWGREIAANFAQRFLGDF